METQRANLKSWVAFAVVTVIGTVLDIWTKVWAFQISNLRYDGKPHLYEKYSAAGDLVPEIVVVPGWFDFRLAMNEGAAFSMFAGQINFFMIITVAATLFLFYLVHTSDNKSLTLPSLLGLVFSGVLGNFWDRVVFGGVRDFIHWHTPKGGFLFFPEYHYPTFNVADIWICVGAIALALYYWNEDRVAAKAGDGSSDSQAPAAVTSTAESAPEKTESADADAGKVDAKNSAAAAGNETDTTASATSDSAKAGESTPVAKSNANTAKKSKKKKKKKRRR